MSEIDKNTSFKNIAEWENTLFPEKSRDSYLKGVAASPTQIAVALANRSIQNLRRQQEPNE